MGADAQISSHFSQIKLSAPSGCGIFVREKKCLDQGTVLQQGVEDEAGGNIILFCVPLESPGAIEPTP